MLLYSRLINAPWDPRPGISLEKQVENVTNEKYLQEISEIYKQHLIDSYKERINSEKITDELNYVDDTAITDISSFNIKLKF